MDETTRKSTSDARRKYQRAEPTNDPERTRSDILHAAETQFARHGYAGTTVDSIASKSRRSKRMIYYYFASKAKLYVAVLEQAYGRMRRAEVDINLEEDDPRQSLKNLVNFCFEFHSAHPNHVKLVMGENLNDAKYLGASSLVPELHRPIIQRIERLLRRGYETEIFRQSITPIEVHMTISALCFFNVSNRATFSAVFDVDMQSPAARRERKRQILLSILGRLDANLAGFQPEYA